MPLERIIAGNRVRAATREEAPSISLHKNWNKNIHCKNDDKIIKLMITLIEKSLTVNGSKLISVSSNFS